LKILESDKNLEEFTIKVETLNDLWSLYNVISKDDEITSRTQRRVVLKEGTKGERKTMSLKLRVESVGFHEFSNRLRIKGTILEGPEDLVSYGTYHTFNIEIGNILSIKKEKWLKSELNRLKEASKFEDKFNMLIIAIETGLATISLVTNYSHNHIATIKKNIPGKRYEQSHRNKAYNDFYDQIAKVLVQNMEKTEIDIIIVCGPGNIRDHFSNYLREKIKFSEMQKVKSFHTSSGTESAINEILKSKELLQIISNVKIIQETQKIEEIFQLFASDPDLIAIGFEEVEKAATHKAIKELFIVDSLIRGASKDHKLRIEDIIIKVEKAQGKVNILSSEHPTGKQIDDLGALVAILHYKL
jgi:protein pelota